MATCRKGSLHAMVATSLLGCLGIGRIPFALYSKHNNHVFLRQNIDRPGRKPDHRAVEASKHGALKDQPEVSTLRKQRHYSTKGNYRTDTTLIN